MSKPIPAKLFVGQIPKAMQESDLQHVFEQYGTIIEFAIIRDRGTKTSKGCAFLTYTSQAEADAAIAGLHNTYTCPGMPSPLQVKYAGTAAIERETENKLFVGMIPRSASDNDLRPIFAPFGEINELTILRGQDGTSKGCAFLRYKNLESATAAVAALNGTFRMPGSPANIVVKFAESKEQRGGPPGSEGMPGLPGGMGMGLGMGGMGGMGMGGMGMGGMAGMGGMPFMGQPYWDPYAQLAQAYGYGGMPPGGFGAGAGMGLPGYGASPVGTGANAINVAGYGGPGANLHGAAGGYGSPQLGGGGYGATQPAAGGYGGAATGAGAGAGAGYDQHTHNSGYGAATAATPNQSPAPYGAGANALNQLAANGPNAAAAAAFQALYGIHSAMQPGAGLGSGATSVPGLGGGLGVTLPSALGSNKEGPPGANLFVYHLPREFTDHDLLNMFSPYGPIESCKVITDKDSGQSKCFGFVSYQSPDSANMAVSQMNGFQVGVGKRIKVELKSARGGGPGFKPY